MGVSIEMVRCCHMCSEMDGWRRQGEESSVCDDNDECDILYR